MFEKMNLKKADRARRMVCHPLCAMIVLLVDILEEPATTQSTKLLQIVKSFTTFLETFQREEKCDLAKLIAACGTFLWVAQVAVHSARDGTDVVVPEGATGVTPEVCTSRQEMESVTDNRRKFFRFFGRPRLP